MEDILESSLWIHISKMEDPRKGQNIQHPFLSIMFIIVSPPAVISGFKHWEDIEDYASANEDWFQSFLDLPNGIPSHNTFRRLFCLLDLSFFRRHLWIGFKKCKNI